MIHKSSGNGRVLSVGCDKCKLTQVAVQRRSQNRSLNRPDYEEELNGQYTLHVVSQSSLAVLPKLQAQGWLFDGDAATCPSCHAAAAGTEHRMLRWFAPVAGDALTISICVLYHTLAVSLCKKLGAGDQAELTVALRKLLESRDCALRAASKE